MSHVNMLPSEGIALLTATDAASAAAGTVNGAWVDSANFHQLLALLDVGVTDQTTDFKLQQATDSSGTGAKDITGKAVTQYTATDDNKQVFINLRPDELDAVNNFRWVRYVLTRTGGTAGLAFAAILGINPKLGLATAFNNASVKQVVP